MRSKQDGTQAIALLNTVQTNFLNNKEDRKLYFGYIIFMCKENKQLVALVSLKDFKN